MSVVGFMTNIGPGRMDENESEKSFCAEVIVTLKLYEGTEITGNDVTCVSYNNETGLATVMFERPVSESLAETLLSKNDIFIFDGIKGDSNDI